MQTEKNLILVFSFLGSGVPKNLGLGSIKGSSGMIWIYI